MGDAILSEKVVGLIIVINAFSARIGGGRSYLVNLLEHLPDDPELRVHVFAPDDLRLPEDPRIVRPATRWPVVKPLTRAIWERFVLPRYLREVGADLLFCPGGVVATRPPPGCALATMFRNMLPFDDRARAELPSGWPQLRNWLLPRVMLRSMREADLTIFISQFARTVIERRISMRRAVTIPHGIPDAFRTAGRDLPRPAGTGAGDYLLYVSRPDAYKHHREVVEAFAGLPEDLRDNVRLLFAGETQYSPGVSAIRALVGQLGLVDRIIFLGPVPYRDLPAYYRNAHAILFASSCENCPNILLESLGAGRPVLCSDVMPMPEFGGAAVAYFSPFDPHDIAAQIAQVLRDPELASRLAAAAVQRSLLYEWKRTADATWRNLIITARAGASPTITGVDG